MKILVDRSDLQLIKETLDNCKYQMNPSKSMSNAIFDVRKIVKKLLDNGITDEDREWAERKIETHQAGKEELISNKEFIELKKRVIYLEEMTGHCLLLRGY